jgi:hypothetical protein
MKTKKEKPPIKVGDRLLAVVDEDGNTQVIYKARVLRVPESGCPVYERPDASGAPTQRSGYLDQEGVVWCRGWTGKAARALRADVAKRAHARKLVEAARDKKYEDACVAVLKRAARIVARAKLPHALRLAAFQVVSVSNTRPFFLQ